MYILCDPTLALMQIKLFNEAAALQESTPAKNSTRCDKSPQTPTSQLLDQNQPNSPMASKSDSFVTIANNDELGNEHPNSTPNGQRKMVKAKRHLSIGQKSFEKKGVHPSKIRKLNPWLVSNSGKKAAKPAKLKTKSKSASSLDKLVAGNSTRIRDTKSSRDDIEMLRVSNFKTCTTVDDILTHLKSNKKMRTDIDKIKCVKLVRKDADINKLTFVSFKLSFPKRFASLLMSAKFWPAGINVVKFDDKSNRWSMQKRTKIV